MAGTDLYTNLILKDSRFKSGLADAEKRSETFGQSINRMNQRFEMLGKVARGAGALALVNRAMGAAGDVAEELTKRVDSSSSAFDRYNASLSTTGRILDRIVFGGGVAQLGFALGGGADAARLESAGRGYESLLTTLNRSLAIESESVEYNRQLLRLRQEQEETMRSIAELGKQGTPLTQLKVLYGASSQLFEARAAALRRAEDQRRAADRDRQYLEQQKQLMDRANGRFGFQEQMDRDRASMLRQQGLKKEADLLELQLEYRRRIRQVVTDTTSGYTFAEKDAMIAALRSNYEQRAAMVGKNDAPKYDRSITAEGGTITAAGLLGQVFATGARSPFSKSEASLKKVEENTAAEVRLLKSIDAGIKHVGTYR